MTANPSETVDKLIDLSFSQYEAKAYVGLVTSSEPQTGYALAKVTDVPQPKIYETLRRLVDRGAAAQVSEDPARYVAVPADHLLAMLESDFLGHLAQARVGLERIQAPRVAELPTAAWALDTQEAVFARAAEMIASARGRVYLSGKTRDLLTLKSTAEHASAGGVEFVVLHFGRPPFKLDNARMVSHTSTEGMLYRRHRAGHLALVADSEVALWALAPGGTDWTGVYMDNPLFASALKAYMRHDIYLQRIFADFGEDLRQQYGLGLERLTDLTPEGSPASAAPRRANAGDRRSA